MMNRLTEPMFLRWNIVVSHEREPAMKPDTTEQPIKSSFKAEELNQSGIQLIFPDGRIINGVLTVEHVNPDGTMDVRVGYNTSPMVCTDAQSFFLLDQKQMESLAKVGDVFVLKT